MTDNNSADSPEFEIQFLSSIQDFLFGAPLYGKYHFESSKNIELMFVAHLTVDGHCPDCQKTATFRRTSGEISLSKFREVVEHQPALFFTITCTRDKGHKIIFVLHVDIENRDNEFPVIQKIGQYPSLADIANGESRTYRQVLNPNDGAELRKAIGLAAHGVGVGAFVYMRRVFERLITQRFEDFKEAEGWSNTDFVRKRMDDKIELLQHHLPDFLVRNRRVYAILSKGIHELQEVECLSAFESLKHAIFFILVEDKHKKKELELRRKAEQAIHAFLPPGATQERAGSD